MGSISHIGRINIRMIRGDTDHSVRIEHEVGMTRDGYILLVGTVQITSSEIFADRNTMHGLPVINMYG